MEQTYPPRLAILKNFGNAVLLLLAFFLTTAENSVIAQERSFGPDSNGILYVNETATGNSAGDRWKDAIPQLADALRIADSLNRFKPGLVKEIWVAKGIYKPMFSAEDGRREIDGGRNNSFVLTENVRLLGGFLGTEGSLNARDTSKIFTDNETILSGDIGIEGNRADNCYHVLISINKIGKQEINGFIIRDGNANGTNIIDVNGASIQQNLGGGLFNHDTYQQIQNCRFLENSAEKDGGAIYNRGGSMDIMRSIFNGNGSLRGGAFYTSKNTNGHNLAVEFSFCHFENNHASAETNDSEGGAIYNYMCSITISNSEFQANTATFGGAVSNFESESFTATNTSFSKNRAMENGGAIQHRAKYVATVRDCSFKENSAGKGGGIAAFNSQLSVINSIFSGNVASDWGGGIYENHSKNYFISSLFSGNKAKYGGGLNIDNGSTSQIIHCTIAGNAASEDGAGGVRIFHSTPVIRNSIIWGNSDGITISGANLNMKYSIVQLADFAREGTKNLVEDPLFKEPIPFSKAPTTEGEYELQRNSPAADFEIDQSVSSGLPQKDLAGKTRIIGRFPDPGAYETQSFAPDHNGVFFVNQNAGGDGDGSSWNHAFTTLSQALRITGQINSVFPGTVKEIWVAKGTYTSDSSLVLLKDVKLFGGFTGTEASLAERDNSTFDLFNQHITTLDGRYAGHVLIAAGDLGDAEINGFVIKRGYANASDKKRVDGYEISGLMGGALYHTGGSISVRFCKFTENRGFNGGAFYSDSGSFHIENCTFENNNAQNWGGAIWIENVIGPSSVTNCLFKDNYTKGNLNRSFREGGGAIHLREVKADLLTISHSTFENNHTPTSGSAQNGGAIFNYYSSPKIEYCSFLGNISTYGGSIFNDHSAAKIYHSDFKNNTALYKGKAGNGGGIYNAASSPIIVNSSFSGNNANGMGGAMINFDGSSPLIAGCVFIQNLVGNTDASYETEGNAIHNLQNSSPAIVNSTFTNYLQNSYHDLYNQDNSSPRLVNCIFWGNDNSIKTTNASSPEITYSIIQQGNGAVWKGDGNMNKNPNFVAINPSDYLNSNYHLTENSPGIGTGDPNISKYQLPEADLNGNPLIVNGKINIGAYAPIFTKPTNLIAAYDNADSVTISWKAILPTGSSYVGGDNFKLERSVDSTFKANVKMITSSYAFDPREVNYTIQDDISDIKGGTRLFYRLQRTAGENQSWGRPITTSTNIIVVNSLQGISAKIISKEGDAPKVKVSWEKFPGVWPTGTTFTLKKKNKTTGTEDAIPIKKEQARLGFYMDDNIPVCKEITYTISVALGNNFGSPADADIPDTVLTSVLSPILNFTASKGYFASRTDLKWSTGGSYDNYIIKRSVYGSNDFEQISAMPGANLQNLQTSDRNGTPGVYYEYEVSGMVKCGSKNLYSEPVVAIGFTSPTGTVYGRVTYEKGGGAVQNATIRMESVDKAQLGRSLFLNGNKALRLDSLTKKLSDSTFTFEAWIKPMEQQPKEQIIFTNEGQYEIGFNGQGSLYFNYSGQEIIGKYSSGALNGFIHVTAIYDRDSIKLMVNDTVIGSEAVSHVPENGSNRRVYIGGNSDRFNFKGFIDEVRLWEVALTPERIARDYTRLLTGGEKGLIAYWQFNASIKDQFFDIAHEGEKHYRNDGFMDAESVWYTDTIPSADQLSLKAYTDSIGNYTITGIPYMGVSGTTYNIGPVLGTHLFDPVAVTRIFASGSSTFTLDFKDKSSYLVSGYVTYQNTTVPVKGVQFKIDGNFAFTDKGGISQTNDDGYFEISVPVGEHEVQAVKPNHAFVNDGKIIDINGNNHNFQNSLANVKIYDSTTIRFIGRVAGGTIETDYPLGFSLSKNILSSDMSITLRLSSGGNYALNSGQSLEKNYQHTYYSNERKGAIEMPQSTTVKYDKNEITIYPDTTTGEFVAEIIPASFKITSVFVNGYDSPLSSAVLFDLTDSILTRSIFHERKDSSFLAETGEWGNYTSFADTVKYNASYVFTVSKEPVIRVEQTINLGNPNTVKRFGNETYSYTNLGGDKNVISLYDKETGTYTFHHPVFQQSHQYGLKITSFEAYPYFEMDGTVRDTTFVPSKGGLVTVSNDMKVGSSAPDTLSIQDDGNAYYSFIAGEPELADQVGLKGFAVSVKIGRKVYDWNHGNTYPCYVFGGRTIGQDFVTTGPQELIGILRDPPGSRSYSYLKKGSTITNTRSFSTTYNETGSLNANISSAPVIKTINGIGVAVATEVHTILETNISATEEMNWLRDSNFVTSTTFEDAFQTSDDPSFSGEISDVFIGRATDITFGSVLTLIPVPSKEIRQGTDIVFFAGPEEGYSIVQRTGLQSGQSFKTLFAYPRYFITDNLIPNLIKIRNTILSEGSALTNPQGTANTENKLFYVSKISPTDSQTYGSSNTDKTVFGDKVDGTDFWDGPSYRIYYPAEADGTPRVKVEDTILIINQHINQWKMWLALNEKAKIEAAYDDNVSFGSGASIDRLETNTSEYTYTESWDWVLNAGLELVKGFQVNKVGIIATASLGGGGGGDSSKANTHGKFSEIGFHLELDGSDYISTDVGKDLSGFPVFRTKGGVTSCPYEGATFTKYYNPGTPLNQPTIQREMPQITVEKPVVSGIAGNRAASYTIHLQNASSIKGDIFFGLNVIDKTNPYGAKIYLDGSALGAGRNVLVPAGEKITKTIILEAGPDSLDYENIQLVLHSTCQYNPQVYGTNIGDTISISAHFLPACSDIHLALPSNQWLLNTNTALNDEGYPYLPVKLDKYDLNKNSFNHIALQYKAATSPDWVTVSRFFTDSTTFHDDKQGGAKEVIQSAEKINYNLVMNPNYSDGRYDIRAVTVCVDNGQIIAQTPSETATGMKDTYAPRLFGNPQPANGVLGIGDDVKLMFNETLDAGFLNNNNFTVKAIKNGSALDSLVSVELDGTKDFVQTEFAKNLTGKNFTVEMWIMPNDKKQGTIFSHGSKNETLELALSSGYHPEVTLGMKTYTGDRALDWLPGQWVHVALTYNTLDSSVSMFYNFQKVLEIPNAGAYKGSGPLFFGKSIRNDGKFFSGKIRNARVWTQALSALQLQTNSSIQLSGGENNLLACYPMSEGKGNILIDKAHGNNASFTGQWQLPAGKSVRFNGDGYVKLNTSKAVITAHSDFTLSVWFKAEPDQTNATILSSGKGNGDDHGGSANLYSLGFQNGKLTFRNNGYEVYADDQYTDNHWHNVVIAANRNTGTAQFYVDGKLQKFFDAGNLGGLASAFTYIGARAFRTPQDSATTQFDQHFKGYIDEVRIWNTYLNSTLIAKDENERLSGKETGLLAWYPFEKHVNYNGIWSTVFTAGDQKVQKDPMNVIDAAILENTAESDEKAPLKNAGPQQDLNYDFVVNNDALVINFTGGPEQRKAIDKTIVTFTARDIKDNHGNLMISPVTWTAYINRNPLKWSDDALHLTKKVYEPFTFEVYVSNSGGIDEAFTLNNMPPWLTASMTSGTVPPQGRQKIVFTVNSGLNVGSYDNIIELNNSMQEMQSLALNIKVTGNTPDWTVNPDDFSYNMSVYGKIRINGVFSANDEDMLAAFINGKCVGVTNNTYLRDNDLWYTLLTVYNDDLKNKTVEFRIWDAATGKMYAGIPSRLISFANDSIAGNPRDPIIFDGSELVFQNIGLSKGWNWISFGVENPAFDNVNSTLANGRWTNSDIVKHDERGFLNFISGSGWIGTLKAFDNLSLFKLKTGNAQSFSVSGTLPDLANTPITIRGNRWSYISYLPQVNLTLKEALANYKATEGDVIKSQTGFAMYDPHLGWIGNLTYLEPGHGYMVFRKVQADETFVYPAFRGSLEIPKFMGGQHRGKDLNPLQLPVESNFGYADNMSVIATVGSGFPLQRHDKIRAFAGNELRSEAASMYNPVTKDSAFFLTISGSEQQPLYFGIERDGSIVATTNPVFGYMSNSLTGSLKEPFVLHFETVNNSGKPDVRIYPNPFKNKSDISIQLHKWNTTATLQILVYNVTGQLVYAEAPKQISGIYKAEWNGKTNDGTECTQGLYFIHLLIDQVPHIYKVIKN